MNFLKSKISGLDKRIRCIRFGIFYVFNYQFRIPQKLLINQKWIQLKFLNANEESFVSEFTQICLDDYYHLKYLKKRLGVVRTIVDIGANQGIFLVAARHYFPLAKIECYEPNPSLREVLGFNASQLNVLVNYHAVMKEDCKVNLQFADSDLSTTVFPDADGSISAIAFNKVIDKYEVVDILKIDCEGAEWEMLQDVNSWSNVRALALEYHLWAKPKLSYEFLRNLLYTINFDVFRHRILSTEQGIIIAINKSFTERLNQTSSIK